VKLVISTLKLTYEREAGPWHDDPPQYLIRVDTPGHPLHGKSWPQCEGRTTRNTTGTLLSHWRG
jgi:hypothetical protein